METVSRPASGPGSGTFRDRGTTGMRRTPGRVAASLAAGLGLAVAGGCAQGAAEPSATNPIPTPTVSRTVAPDEPTAPVVPSAPVDVSGPIGELEDEYQALVGVYAFDAATGAVVAHRHDERFAYASTIKSLAAAAVLDRSTSDDLDDIVAFSADDLVTHSPVTQEHVEAGMTLREVIHAAIRQSDNTAGNLLFDRLGGPEGLQAELRRAGDETTVVSRREPELNDYSPGDDQDTTTAEALARTLAWYSLGGGLDPEERELLLDSMRGVRTGDGTIRAGTPNGWTVANKTGSASHGTRNDLAVLWPDDGTGPIVLAVLTRTQAADGTNDDQLLAETTAIVLEALTDAGPAD